MKVTIYLCGTKTIPNYLKKNSSYDIKLIDNPYQLKGQIDAQEGEKVVVSYLPFLEMRNLDLHSFLQDKGKTVQTVFVVNEISAAMRTHLKNEHRFIVLWKTEENSLLETINKYLEGKQLKLREEKRLPLPHKALITPSFPKGEAATFRPIMGGNLDNVSSLGSCLKIQAPFYGEKEFVRLSFQNNEGEYVSLHGQVRWSKWNEADKTQELGIQFVTS